MLNTIFNLIELIGGTYSKSVSIAWVRTGIKSSLYVDEICDKGTILCQIL